MFHKLGYKFALKCLGPYVSSHPKTQSAANTCNLRNIALCQIHSFLKLGELVTGVVRISRNLRARCVPVFPLN